METFLSFLVSCTNLVARHINWPKTMADRPLGGASMSADSDKNDEIQCILKSMQTITDRNSCPEC